MILSKKQFKSSNRFDGSEIVEFRGSRQINLEQVENELYGDSSSTPLGQLLEIIGSLPEIRQEKVFNVRDRLSSESYDLEGPLDSAIDKVLEELLSDG